ncbi:hypothetical protein BBK36DRAFT_1196884 [Trichoderma citrinoviride]|uniref:Cytokinesis regulator n=1 Tax=Trichoderma citrinoviride TaxID=58853 RepID=A0A2T4BE72_9HYPO|nr:hypothetical protein BBK36DRAFT_1196884 [Trichoderma citrinoviride]PTB67499.1 hypothetical protein BBK36DRAFT_1196884 [Trichoderma citrinoviride]
MEPLRLKPRQPVEAEIENWDDDDFIVDGDELSLRPAAVTTGTNAQPRRRDSTSSHISLRSDLDSAYGEEQHVHLPADDERSTMAAIAAAERAGIPLPKNVPSSALTGGTIKRLGGKKMRKTIDEDWEHDLELPDGPQGLQMKPRTHADFPETLRHVSGGSMHNSPKKTPKSARDSRRSSIMSNSSVLSAALSLDRFRDTEDEDDDFFGDGFDTIKVPKTRPPQLLSFVTPPKPVGPVMSKEPLLNEEDFERDLELPSDGTLRLSARRDIPRAPFALSDDIDWGEGSSLGTRYGGTRRDARSTRSSSVSAMSPSLSSTFTVESEDETFDGLVLPPGHLNFQERLQLRKTNPPPEDIPEEQPAEAAAPPPPPPKKLHAAAEVEQQDFLEGLDIGDGNVFDAGKLTIHRNIKVKDSRVTNPARPKTSVTLTFSNKPMPPQTRIPRLNNHERSHSTALEPVSESGGPIPHRAPRRPQSRLGHAANQLSVTSLPTPTSSSFSIAPAPRRAELSRPQFSSSRSDPPTTNSQLLRQKRSLATVRSRNPPTTAAKPIAGRAERPSSRTETGLARPKTPQERPKPSSESPGQARKNSIPFIPAGASHSQSQHAASKAVRQYRRYDPDNANDARPISRSFARPGLRSPSPHRLKEDTWGRLNRPKRKQNFGDGHELDAFDDLPTSKETESRFLKQPSAAGPPKATLRRLPQAPAPSAAQAVDRNKTPSPWNAAPTAARSSYTPSFARDTAASRIARETALAHRTPSGGPLASVSAQRAPTRSNAQQSQPTSRTKKLKRPPQLKPHLISNLSGGKESKVSLPTVVKGMFYNADTYRWEGNENVLNAFDGSTTPSSNSAPLRLARDKEPTASRPALITNISATKGVQVVGGMVFDPQNMCWLKLGPQSMAPSEATDSLDNFNGFEEEEDPFKDIPDLEDTTVTDEREGHASDIKDDWLVGEEFDVGPEFIRRQREEEERWRKKCEKWTSHAPRDREAWRWTIRELVIQFDDFAMPGGAR